MTTLEDVGSAIVSLVLSEVKDYAGQQCLEGYTLLLDKCALTLLTKFAQSVVLCKEAQMRSPGEDKLDS